MPPPTLPPELLEEIFLRLPPAEPAWLVRATLASKFWLGLLTGPAFRARYRDFHGAPPMLGFLYTSLSGSVHEDEPFPPFVSTTTKFEAAFRDDDDWIRCQFCYGWDCRHGRVLLCDMDKVPILLVVWDPVTGDWRDIHAPEDYDSQQAAVLCAQSGCDHRACRKGPFRVVFVALDQEYGCDVHECVSSLETAEQSKPLCRLSCWSTTCYGLDHLWHDARIEPMPPVLIENALHFMIAYVDNSVAILKYDVGAECLSLIDAPLVETDIARATIIMGADDGRLEFARVDGLSLNLWSRQIGFDGVGTWTQRIVINLKELLPIQIPEQRLRLLGSVEGTDIIFVSTNLGIYEINLKSLQWKKIWKKEEFRALFPYMSFHNPPEKVSPFDAAR